MTRSHCYLIRQSPSFVSCPRSTSSSSLPFPMSNQASPTSKTMPATPHEDEPPRYTFKQDRTLTLRGTLSLAFVSLGIIYGDIGTSPCVI